MLVPLALGVLPLGGTAIAIIGRRTAWAILPAVMVGVAVATCVRHLHDGPLVVAFVAGPMLVAGLAASFGARFVTVTRAPAAQ
jgi:hypothetical protein